MYHITIVYPGNKRATWLWRGATWDVFAAWAFSKREGAKIHVHPV